MKQGSLSDYFVGVGVKTLSGTEVDPRISHGHELQGISRFRKFIGDCADAEELPVTFVWLSDVEPPVSLTLFATWYDSRKAQPHRAPEYRFYYPREAEEIVYRAKDGDTLFLCQPKDGALLALFCSRGSSIEQQLLWLFGIELQSGRTLFDADLRRQEGRALDLAARHILELIGVEVVVSEDDWLERLIAKFGPAFPSTSHFSQFARDALPHVNGRDDPDQALVAWMDFEERLFMTLERHIVGERLKSGFINSGKPDVNAFVSFSLSVQNRRKARAGWAFGNHIEALLAANDIRYKREATTEKRSGPDFLFPGEAEYHSWPKEKWTSLTMLGAKTSCKDRWRQVLAEADRIERKHLLTLEPGISETQTSEMMKEKLQLVLPREIHETYRPAQLPVLMDVCSFIELVRARQ